jgi:ERCC4-type nuclease
MASLNYFKGFSVTRTMSMAETAQYIEITADKIARELAKGTVSATTSVNSTVVNTTVVNATDNTVTTETPSNVEVQATTTQDYCSVVKVSKKANITRDNIGQLMLMQIPGISSTISGEIMRPFATFAAFLDHLRAEPTYLDNIVLESSGKKRKLGSNIIAGIRDYLL